MEGLINWLPWTGIVVIDCILGFFYLVAGGLAIIGLGVLAFFVVAILVMSIPVWVPILIVVVIIMKICGL